MVLFMKSKNPVERAEQEEAKARFLQAQITEERLKGNLKTQKDKNRSAELRRLRA